MKSYLVGPLFEPFCKMRSHKQCGSLKEMLNCLFKLKSLVQSISNHVCTDGKCNIMELKQLFQNAMDEPKELSIENLRDRLPSSVLSNSDPIDLLRFILSMIHNDKTQVNDGNCKFRCCLHENFPVILEEIICPCGEFRGGVKSFQYYITISVKNLVKPPFSNKEFFTSLCAKDIYELIYFSSAKGVIDTLIPSFLKDLVCYI